MPTITLPDWPSFELGPDMECSIPLGLYGIHHSIWSQDFGYNIGRRCAQDTPRRSLKTAYLSMINLTKIFSNNITCICCIFGKFTVKLMLYCFSYLTPLVQRPWESLFSRKVVGNKFQNFRKVWNHNWRLSHRVIRPPSLKPTWSWIWHQVQSFSLVFYWRDRRPRRQK